MNMRYFIVVAGAMVLFAGCGSDRPEGRVEITPPAADLSFEEAFVKDRDIYFNMPEGSILGEIGYTVVNSKGNLIVVDSTQWIVFQTDAKGNYLRQIGTRGGAEGEYFYVLKLLLSSNGDLYIHTVGESMKYLVFASDSYEFKKEVPDPNPEYVDHIVFTKGDNMYASEVDSEYALSRLDGDFNKIRSLYPVEDQRTGEALNRYHNTLLTPRGEGGFYFMYPTTYEIHQYSEQGELEQTLFSAYQSKYRDGIKPFPIGLDPKDFNPEIEAWLAGHIVRFQLYEYDPDLLVLVQFRREVGGEFKYYLNLLYKDGHSVADGIRVPANHILLTIAGTEIYFAVEGMFDEATGEISDPYVAVYRLNDRAEPGKSAFSRSQGS